MGLFSWFRRERKRQIFTFWDGNRLRRIDPMVVWEKLVEHPTFVEERHVTAALRGEPEAVRIVVATVCDVFGVREWSEGRGGLLRNECFDLLSSFYDYLDALKKNTVEHATSLPPMDSESSVEESATSATSESG